MYKVHVEGTRLLCDAAKVAGVKTIVLASTSGTIAVTKDGEMVPDESYPDRWTSFRAGPITPAKLTRRWRRWNVSTARVCAW